MKCNLLIRIVVKGHKNFDAWNTPPCNRNSDVMAREWPECFKRLPRRFLCAAWVENTKLAQHLIWLSYFTALSLSNTHTHTLCCYQTKFQTHMMFGWYFCSSLIFSSFFFDSLSLESAWFLCPLSYLALTRELGYSCILVVKWNHLHRSLSFLGLPLQWSSLCCPWPW